MRPRLHEARSNPMSPSTPVSPTLQDEADRLANALAGRFADGDSALAAGDSIIMRESFAKPAIVRCLRDKVEAKRQEQHSGESVLLP